MRLSVLEGSLAQVFLNWTTGSVLTGYMLHLGASANQLALVASVPLLAQAASPLAAYLVTNLGHRKLFTMLGAGLGRGLWALAVLLPQLGIPEPLQPTFLVLCVLISSVFLSSNATLWSSWMADIVPAHRRGAYFGLRTGVIGVIGMLGNLLAGALLDRLAAPLGFQLVLGIAVISGLLGMLLYLFHFDPPVSAARHSLAKLVQVPLRDANFRRFLLFAIYWQFSVFIAAPFVFPYFLDELGMSFTQTAIWSVIALTCALGTTIFWGRIADQSGNKAVLAVGTFVAGAVLPTCWILAGLSGNLDFIWASAVFDAVAWGAIGPAIFNLALASAPAPSRMMYMGMYSLASGVAGFLGGVLSGPLLSLLQQLEFSVFGLLISGYHLLFLLSGVARAQAWRFLRGVEETNAWRTRDVLRYLRSGWRAIGMPWRS